jgi:rod shape-determining protein MreB
MDAIAGHCLFRSFDSTDSGLAAFIRCPRIGLDLGTANTLVYVDGRGLALDEPSIVTVRASTGEIEAAGSEAEAGFGRTPRKLHTHKPIRAGTVHNLKLCEGMLQRFLRKAEVTSLLRRFRAIVAVRASLTEVERMAVVESLLGAKAGDVLLVEQTLAAAQGAGLAIEEPRGHMVVDIGAGATSIALISLGAIVQSRTILVAGDEMDAAIVSHVHRHHHVLIGERTAERVKIEIGSAQPDCGASRAHVKGRCLTRGIPRSVSLGADEVQEALAEPIRRILAAVREVLEQVPPELSADLLETGIVLTGGSALLRNLDQHISREFGLPVSLAENPLNSVVLGLARQLSYMRRRDWNRFRHNS